MKTIYQSLLMTIILCLAGSVAFAQGYVSKWSKEDVEKYCYNQASGNARAFDSCMKHKENKIGRDKQPGDDAYLNKIDQKFKAKADARAPKKETQNKKD